MRARGRSGGRVAGAPDVLERRAFSARDTQAAARGAGQGDQIANACSSSRHDEGAAIRIAIAKAKEWAAQRGLALDADALDPTSATCIALDEPGAA